MLVPVLTTEKVILLGFCPQCGKPLAVKFSLENGMPFIACDNCDYKREFILFKECPKCGGKMKYIHKHNKFKCNGCNTWYEVELKESSLEKGEIQSFTEGEIRKIVRDEVLNHLEKAVSEMVIKCLIYKLKK